MNSDDLDQRLCDQAFETVGADCVLLIVLREKGPCTVRVRSTVKWGANLPKILRDFADQVEGLVPPESHMLFNPRT